jgi:hypothetical protein
MAAISKATHDTMIAAVKAVKDTYPNAYYIQRVLNTALCDLRAGFLNSEASSDAIHAPVSADAISATSDAKVVSPGASGAPEFDVVKS